MARFVTGNTFGTTDTVTATTLNNAVNNAAISTDSVDNNTIEVNSNALRLKDSASTTTGITTAKIADSSSKTTGVTFAKMQHISTAKILGRASASEGDIEEAFDFKDEDDMSSNSATALASQQSIKAYVDSAPNFTPSSYNSEESVTFPNGLIIKMGKTSNISADSSLAVSFSSAFPNAIVSVVITKEDSIRLGSSGEITVNTVSASGFTVANGADNTAAFYFMAIGR